MKIQKFSVPATSLAVFSDFVSENELENQILGTDRKGNVVVEVTYSSSERDTVGRLEDVLERDIAMDKYFGAKPEPGVPSWEDDEDDEDDEEDDEEDDDDDDQDEDDEEEEED